jgi:hypothetical protein
MSSEQKNNKQYFAVEIIIDKARGRSRKANKYREDCKKEYRFMSKLFPEEFSSHPVEDYHMVIKMIACDGECVYEFPTYEDVVSLIDGMADF